MAKMHSVAKVFGNSMHVKVILLFYNNNGYFDNITGLAKILGVSQVTVRKVVSDLLEVGLLSDSTIGMSRVLKVNENSPYTKALFDFIDSLRSINESKSMSELIEMRTGQTGFKNRKI